MQFQGYRFRIPGLGMRSCIFNSLAGKPDPQAAIAGEESRARATPACRIRTNHPPLGAFGLTAALALLALTACGFTTPITASSRAELMGGAGEPSFAQFTDIPVPAGATMDLERSLVLGDRESWIGRIVLSVSDNASRVYDFYFDEMPKFEWSPVTTVRAGTSVLTYTRGERVATIQIAPRTIGGATVSVTVSPRGRPSPPGGGAEIQVMPAK